MSLLVRLPLNGNLNNYGSADVTVTVTGTTSYGDGRSGKALSCNGSSYWTVTGVTLGSEASIACWSKTSTNGKMSWVLVATSSDKLNLYESSQYCLNTGDGNSNLFKDGSGNAINCLHDNQWHHFVVTFGNNIAKLYIDGAYRGTATTFKSPATTSAKTIKLAGGYAGGHSYDWNGLISDFRVYDECLSESEIKHLIRGKGLRLWLPLNGSIENQGLDSTIPTLMGSGITYVNGKIGKAVQFPNNCNSCIHMPGLKLQTGSWAAWIKVLGTGATSRQCLISEGRDSYNDGVEFYTNQAGTTLYFKAHSVILSTTIVLNTWYHVVGTFGDNNIKLYVDGILKASNTYTDDMTYTYSSGRFVLGKMSYSYTNASNYFSYNGCLNDVRVYDYALSVKEIKKLSKLLVLHYLLNRGGLGQENIIPNSKIDGSWTYPSSSYSDKYSTVTTVIPSATQYTLSFDAKSTVGGDKMRTHYYSPNTTTTCVSSQGVTKTASDGNMDFTLSTQWQRYWVTYTQTETTAVKHLICPRLVSGQGSGTVSVKNVKLEEGSIATPWCPNSSDVLATTMGLNSTIEYDCSGFCNNGTRTGTFSWTSDTPKYQVSTAIEKGIITSTNSFITTADPVFSVSLWFKLKSGVTYTAYTDLISFSSSSYSNQPFRLEICGSPVGKSIMWFRGPSGQSGGFAVKSDLSFDTWYHTVLVSEGNKQYSYYINGNKLGTYNGSANSWTPTGNVSLGENINGVIYESDFRIYATALSADDIAELYNGGVL